MSASPLKFATTRRASNGNPARVLTEKDAVLITPELAEQLLARNQRNRRLRESTKVAEFAGAMLRGEWLFNGDPIRLTADGRLLDGQHRLAAVVSSGCSILALLVEVAPEAQATMDQGTKRTFGDVCYIAGEPYANNVAAVARLVWAWEQNGIPSLQNNPAQPTIAQLAEVLRRHPDIREALARAGTQPLLTKTFAAAHWYIFSRVDVEAADGFFEGLSTGEGLMPGNPIHTLRERLLRAQQNRTASVSPIARTLFCCRAFLAYLEGETLDKLVFKEGASKPDRFPIVRPSA